MSKYHEITDGMQVLIYKIESFNPFSSDLSLELDFITPTWIKDFVYEFDITHQTFSDVFLGRAICRETVTRYLTGVIHKTRSGHRVAIGLALRFRLNGLFYKKSCERQVKKLMYSQEEADFTPASLWGRKIYRKDSDIDNTDKAPICSPILVHPHVIQEPELGCK
jgi:hypothetical protein